MSHPEKRQNGFVLMTAVWVLLLCGAIMALIMLKVSVAAQGAWAQRQALQRDLAADNAVEAILADRLISGARSSWASLPAEGDVDTSAGAVRARVTSEAGRLDINEASLTDIDSVLRELGADSASRAQVLEAIETRRAARSHVRSFPELADALSAVVDVSEPCALDLFTFASGRVRPAPWQAPPLIARALNFPGAVRQDSARENIIRIEIAQGGGATHSLTMVVRMEASGPQVVAFRRRPLCFSRRTPGQPVETAGFRLRA